MKLLLYTNILTPYRKYFYDLIYQKCLDNNDEFKVYVMAENEPNRNWEYDDLKSIYTELLDSKTRSRGETYIHFNMGLKNKLVEYRPNVVICAGSYISPGIWTVCKYKKNLDYKVFFWSESHLNEYRKYNSIKLKVREKIRKIVYGKFDGFLYAGKLSKEFILNYNKNAEMFFLPNLIDEKKYKDVVNFTNLEKDNIINKYGLNKRKFIFVCPARLSPVKGILEFLNLFSKTQSYKNATILIAGDGELEKDIKRYSAEKDLDVRLLGYKSQNEVIELYSIADSFLMPSLSDPNPLTSIEALFSGLPLLISNHVGNYPEVVKEGVNGYILDYSAEDESVKKIDRLLNSPEEWYQQAKNISLNIATEKFGSEEKTKELLVFLKSFAKKQETL